MTSLDYVCGVDITMIPSLLKKSGCPEDLGNVHKVTHLLVVEVRLQPGRCSPEPLLFVFRLYYGIVDMT